MYVFIIFIKKSRKPNKFKTSPKNPHPRIHKNGFPIRRTLYVNFSRPPSPLHNGLHATASLIIKKSIKLRSAKWGRRTLKN